MNRHRRAVGSADDRSRMQGRTDAFPQADGCEKTAGSSYGAGEASDDNRRESQLFRAKTHGQPPTDRQGFPRPPPLNHDDRPHRCRRSSQHSPWFPPASPVPPMRPLAAKGGPVPFYTNAPDALPNYVAGAKWGTQTDPIRTMQVPMSPADSAARLVLQPGFSASLFRRRTRDHQAAGHGLG